MKLMNLNYVCLLLVASTLTGCVTYQNPADANREAARKREEARQARARLSRVNGDVETLQMEIDRLSGELAQLREARDNDLIQFDAKLSRMAAAQAADKKEIVAVLTKKIEKLLKSVAQQAASSSSHGSDYGIEHVVRPGETLSAIAKAYAVSSRAIISANKLKNADRLRVGQKLFIPQ